MSVISRINTVRFVKYCVNQVIFFFMSDFSFETRSNRLIGDAEHV